MRSLAFLLLAATPLPFLQHPGSDDSRNRGTEVSRRATEGDGILAAWLVTDGKTEIALARIAVERAQDPKVKQFAQMMINEHGAMNQKLQPFAANTGNSSTTGTSTNRDRDTGSDRDDQGRGDEDRGDTGGVGGRDDSRGTTGSASGRNTSTGMRGDFDHVALIEELGRQCVTTARQELESKSGAEFDMAYMGMMVAAHNHANDMLTVFRRHVSGELENVMADGQRRVSAHLAQAKDIKKQLKHADKDGRVSSGE